MEASNFSFLQHHEFAPFFPLLHKAEQQALTDPTVCAFLVRKSLEQWLKWLYDNDETLEVPTEATLNGMLFEASFQALLPQRLWQQLNTVRKIGNNAAHAGKETTPREGLDAVKMLHDFALWVVRLYSRSQTPVGSFNEALVPTGTPVERTRRQLEVLAQQYEEAKAQLKRTNEALEYNAALRAQLEAQLAQISSIKEENKTSLAVTQPHYNLTEKETRELYINVMLKEAGWDLSAANTREFKLEYVYDAESSCFADYVLWGNDAKPLAVVEAKRTTIDAYKGKRQAQLYADSLEKMYGQRPIIFYTNGYETYIWDDAIYKAARPVQGFYAKEELELLINRRHLRQPLSTQEIN